MSFNAVVNKLLLSMKEELQKEENIEIMKNDIIKPVVEQIFMIMYPYFVGIGSDFIMIIMSSMSVVPYVTCSLGPLC